MPARGESAPGISGDDDGKIIVVVAVSIGNAATIDDHRVVKQGLAVHVFGGFEFIEEIGELLHVEDINLGDFIQVGRLLLVVGNVVVALGDADLLEASVRSIMCHQEGGDAGGIRFEGEDHHIKHELKVFFIGIWSAFGCWHAGIFRDAHGLGFFNLALDLAYAGEVFIKLVTKVTPLFIITL